MHWLRVADVEGAGQVGAVVRVSEVVFILVFLVVVAAWGCGLCLYYSARSGPSKREAHLRHVRRMERELGLDPYPWGPIDRIDDGPDPLGGDLPTHPKRDIDRIAGTTSTYGPPATGENAADWGFDPARDPRRAIREVKRQVYGRGYDRLKKRRDPPDYSTGDASG